VDPLVAELTQPKNEPAPVSQANVSHGPPSAAAADSSAKTRSEFRARVAELKAQLKASHNDEAGQLVALLDKQAESLGPSEQQEAADLAFQVAAKAEDHRKMRTSADRWLLSCGPDRVASCRQKALSAFEKAARGPPRSASSEERLKQIRKADHCLQAIESGGKTASVPACLADATDLYRRIGDHLMLARALFLRGVADAANEKKLISSISELGYADSACDEARCASQRRKVLERLIDLNARAGDVEEAAKAAIRAMEIANTARSSEPLYARTRAVEQTCARLDDKSGPGTCRALEKRLTGHYTFHDFTKERAGDSLPPEKVHQVGREYGVLIDECLRAEAERMTPPAVATYTVRWVVNNSGLIEQLHMEKKDLDDGALANCLRKQASIWRYPRTNGELQHIEQAFTIRATER
jgi:hypothetical protein